VVEPTVEIPDRAAFKASEVCEIAQIPPYVLKSWEKEFPGLGVSAKPGGFRVYRRSDIEQILRIKQLVFTEGLTLAGARRRLEGEPAPEPDPVFELTTSDEVRGRISKVKGELRSLLDVLSRPAEAAGATDGAESAGGPAELSGTGVPPVRRADLSTPPPTWPPASAARPTAAPDATLPLIDGVSDTPPARGRRRARAKPGHDSEPSVG
jgi:DNA-binding transcriptional MerR regulator